VTEHRGGVTGVWLVAALLALYSIVPGRPPSAAEHSELVDRLRICRSLTAADARLRCFDDATSILEPNSGAVAADSAPADSAGPRELAIERQRLARQRRELERREQQLARISEHARVLTDPKPADLEAAFGANQLPDYDKPLPSQKLDEFRARIVGVAARPTGEWVMTLENGQIWMQTQPEPYPLDPADGPVEVVLFRSLFGGFYLRKVDENVRLRVKRIH